MLLLHLFFFGFRPQQMARAGSVGSQFWYVYGNSGYSESMGLLAPILAFIADVVNHP
jgi:hypothetical protein